MAVVISGRETEAPSISDITKVNSDFNPFSARGPIYRPPLCLRRMREADVSAHFFQALQQPYLTSDVRSIYTAAKSAHLVP